MPYTNEYSTHNWKCGTPIVICVIDGVILQLFVAFLYSTNGYSIVLGSCIYLEMWMVVKPDSSASAKHEGLLASLYCILYGRNAIIT